MSFSHPVVQSLPLSGSVPVSRIPLDGGGLQPAVGFLLYASPTLDRHIHKQSLQWRDSAILIERHAARGVD
jgi:hypothetical protein